MSTSENFFKDRQNLIKIQENREKEQSPLKSLGMLLQEQNQQERSQDITVLDQMKNHSNTLEPTIFNNLPNETLPTQSNDLDQRNPVTTYSFKDH